MAWYKSCNLFNRTLSSEAEQVASLSMFFVRDQVIATLAVAIRGVNKIDGEFRHRQLRVLEYITPEPTLARRTVRAILLQRNT